MLVHVKHLDLTIDDIYIDNHQIVISLKTTAGEFVQMYLREDESTALVQQVTNVLEQLQEIRRQEREAINR